MTSRNKNSILCPNCRKLISADEFRCPYCGISKPGSWWKNNLLTQGVSSADQIIKAVIYANIGMYIISLLFNSRLPGLSFNPFYILSPENRSLLLLGATGTIPVDNVHGWWTLVSANYLHGGILHILFNMFAFSQIAPLVSREYGVYRMFIIYTLSGIIGFRISYLAGVAFTIGASAAICGLIGAAIYYGKSRGGTYGQAIYRQIGGWALGIMLFGFVVPGINNWGARGWNIGRGCSWILYGL
jgi:rhomboid protease GluP